MSAPEKRTIGPAEAEQILVGNTKNRNVSRTVVSRYANAMTRGEWMLSNDIICVDPEGVLLNGQHRLHALVESNSSQEFWYWAGCPSDARMAMDMGNRRDAADTATLSGTPISKAFAKALRLIKNPITSKTTQTASPAVLIEWFSEWGDSLEMAKMALPAGAAYRNHALYLAAAAEAICWKPDCAEQVGDFFGIMVDNTTVTERPVDSAGRDHIPAAFFKWNMQLQKQNKRVSSFSHYKLILNGLQSYIDDAQWPKSKRVNIEDAPKAAVLFQRQELLG